MSAMDSLVSESYLSIPLIFRLYLFNNALGRMFDLRLKEKLGGFSSSFIALKNALDSGIGLHTAFVSARILDKIDAMREFWRHHNKLFT